MVGVNANARPILATSFIVVPVAVVGAIVATHWLMRRRTLESALQRTPTGVLVVAGAVMLFLIVISQGSGNAVWAQDFDDVPHDPQEIAEALKDRDKQIERATRAVAKLRARGVPVLFVREPSTGDYLAYEGKAYPRADNWDLLLSKVGVPGIYYADYPALSNGYDLPDWSHMSKSSAERYTAALYDIIDRQYGAPLGVKW